MVTKAAAGVLLVGLIGTGGVALTKPGWLGISSQPPSTSLEEDHDYATKKDSDTEYKNKFGAANSKNLVGVYGTADNQEGNKAWWEWSFERLKQDKVSEGNFAVTGGTNNSNAKVTQAYVNSSYTSQDKTKALNQVCYAVYKSEPSKIKTNPVTSNTDEYKESEVWRYCSKSGTKPTSKPNTQ